MFTTTVPVRETALLEARTSFELLERLGRVREDGLPGFVVRASGLVDIGADTHDKVTEALVTTLLDNPDLGWRPNGNIIKLRLGATSHGIGGLHHDMHTYLSPELRVQRTKHGNGNVTLANAGEVGFDIPMALEDEADSLFQEGAVNPLLIHPAVHTAELSQGDMVVFPPVISLSDSHQKAGPVWHRFDTSSSSRQGEVLAVKLVG